MNRTAQQVLRDRRRTNRAAARIRRRGVATMAGHCIAAGLTVKQARTAAQSLRKNAVKADIGGQAGISYAGRRPARPCTRFTPQDARRAAQSYRPRADYAKRARAVLLAA